MVKLLKFTLFITFLLAPASIALGQAVNPTVEIVLDNPSASIGDTLTAEVIIRNAVNIAGADVGISVDPTCLRIVERTPGEFLPTKSEEGGFSAFSELNEHDTRLAASLLGRSRIAQGDGVFYRATLEVTCEGGFAPVEVSFVELTGIEDLEADNTRFIVYKLDTGNVTATNAELTVGPAAQATPIPTTAPAATAEATPVTPTAPAPTVAPQSNTSVVIVLIVLMVLIGVVLYALVRTIRRR
jgi:hypothetical protein